MVLTDILEGKVLLLRQRSAKTRASKGSTSPAKNTGSGCYETLSAFGRIDVLINNTGVTGSHPDVLNTDTWDKQMNVNARGVFGHACRNPENEASR